MLGAILQVENSMYIRGTGAIVHLSEYEMMRFNYKFLVIKSIRKSIFHAYSSWSTDICLEWLKLEHLVSTSVVSLLQLDVCGSIIKNIALLPRQFNMDFKKDVPNN